MRHRRRSRVLGRSPSHRKALFRNLTSALFLTQRDAEFDDNAPKVKGRIITTTPKAKEVRPLVERCITIAKRALPAKAAADALKPAVERNTQAWKDWRQSEKWREWAQAASPYIAARRRVFAILRDKEAVKLLFEVIAPRYVDRPGGYTRVLKLAKPRLGDAGQRAILELVGVRDRVTEKAEKPAFGKDE